MAPLVVVNVLSLDSLEPKYIELILLGIYVVQYSVNFFVYAARYDQYRKAYIFFLRQILHAITCGRIETFPDLEISSRLANRGE